MGLKLGVFRVFLVIKRTGSSGAHVTCIYCSLSVKINKRKIVDAFVLAHVYKCVVSKNLETPILSHMADDAITRAVYKVWDLSCISVAPLIVECYFKVESA